VRAEIYWMAGDTTHARRYADSARGAFEQYLRATPNDEQQRLFLGLSLAYLGQPAAAVREGQHGLELAVATGDEYANIPAAHHVLAQIYATVGDQPRALAQLDTLLAMQYFLSPAWLKIDPTWAPLHGNTGFERLLTQPAPTVGR
jgi:tetratricopeptide (TPR) repeat protein